jgi:integrase
MIYKPKGRQRYRVKFKWGGKVIHKSTMATDAKTARSIESTIRSELAKGNFGILKPKPKPTLGAFLKNDFLPFVESRHKAKPATLRYYQFGAERLQHSDMAGLHLADITDQHAMAFAARNASLSASTINCGLRTLRRALRLAYKWGKLERPAQISLASGERQRDRVLSPDEIVRYLEACQQPWRDMVVVLYGTGMRPGELYPLRWENVLLEGEPALIQVTGGKSKAARRLLPMLPPVREVLLNRYEQQGKPSEGFVFPADSPEGHITQGTAKNYHMRALKAANEERDPITGETKERKPTLKSFEPYVLRHTALTRLAESGCDAFTLARIAGHSSIAITQRYCHPQQEAIERAFKKLALTGEVVTTGGHQPKQPGRGGAKESR